MKLDRCIHNHPDCFGMDWDTGKYCRILSSTDFNGRDCPYYKSREQMAAEDQGYEWQERLHEKIKPPVGLTPAGSSPK